MKINKILAAGVAATLAVTSLSAVVYAEPQTKVFDMGTSIATYKLTTTENWKSVDFLAQVDATTGATIPSSAIVPPLIDGAQLVYDFTDAYFQTWGGTVKTDSVKNGGLTINSVTLKVTGIMGSKNNSSKEYTYSFAKLENGLKYALTMNQSVGKGFIPTQFVEITKAEVVIDFQFDSISETLFKRAKNSNDKNAEWGGGLQNIKVTTVDTPAVDLDKLKKAAEELKVEWDKAEAAYDKAKKEYDAAVKTSEGKKADAQAKLDAAKQLLNEVNSQILAYKASKAWGTYLTGDFRIAVDNRMDPLYAFDAANKVVAGATKIDVLLTNANTAKTEAEGRKKTASENKAKAQEIYTVAKNAVLNADANAVITENADGTSNIAWAVAPADAAALLTNFQTAYAQKVAYTNAEATADADIAAAQAKIDNATAKIKELDDALKEKETALKKPYTDAVDEAQAELDAIAGVDDTAVKKALEDADLAETAYTIAWALYLDALAVGGDNIISVINGLVPGGYENASFGDITSEVRYAPLPRTTTSGTITRQDVDVLSITGAWYSENIWSDTAIGYDANQSYKNDDVHQGTAPRQFAGLASQAADFFNKQDNGKIIFKFTPAAASGSTWVNGGVPSTEVGLKSALAGTNFGMFWNYNSSTGQLVSLGQVDSDALTVTFDISGILDDMGGLTKGNLNDIFYGLNTGITYGAPYNFTGYLVETITFSYEDSKSETDAEVEDVDDTDDDDEYVEDDDDDDYYEDDDDDDYYEDDDDDDDDYFIDDDEEDDDDAFIDEDDDDDVTPVVVVSDDDDTDTNNDVVIITPVKEDDDANPGTGVGLAVIPALVAAAAVVVSKKRK